MHPEYVHSIADVPESGGELGEEGFHRYEKKRRLTSA